MGIKELPATFKTFHTMYDKLMNYPQGTDIKGHLVPTGVGRGSVNEFKS